MRALLAASSVVLAVGLLSAAPQSPPAEPPPPEPAAPEPAAPSPEPTPAPAPAPKILEFQFEPAVGTHTEAVHETRLVQIGKSPASTLTTDVRFNVTVERTSDGYLFHRDVASLRSTNGKDTLDDFPTTRIRFAPITLHVDFKGQIDDLTGFDEAIEDAILRAPEARRDTLARGFSELNLEKAERRTWNDRIQDFVGNRFEEGELLVASDSMDLPGGDIVDYRMLVRIVGLEPCGKEKCARVEFAFGTEIEPLAEFADTPVDEMREALGKMENRGGSTITGDGLRLFEPGTMRMHREEIRQTIRRPVSVPGQGDVVMLTDDEIERTWQYPAGGGE